jgi:DNA polymerase III epsilon subunit-like protein
MRQAPPERDRETRLRILVSLAYEVVDPERGTVLLAHYDVVKLPAHAQLDPASQRVHGITVREARRKGRELRDVLQRLCGVVRRHAPVAAVGHDVAGDVVLLVSECLRCGLSPTKLRGLLPQRLVCTKLAATGRCGIPLPKHLRYPFPCDVQLQRITGRPPPDARDPARYKWPSLPSFCVSTCHIHVDNPLEAWKRPASKCMIPDVSSVCANS